ncbi:hypothetical protein QTI33_09015 [Variovorax sp. J22P271]|uniref:hypothetical protein n=1 Tax=Variovorax davisae TaxID=3053515 RepID=UPI002574ED34|nr:hypothetical protein [Variovorax sp. J22P271]MDM0032267.1 hypothetical protein [Variovorax sp. J22P271]
MAQEPKKTVLAREMRPRPKAGAPPSAPLSGGSSHDDISGSAPEKRMCDASRKIEPPVSPKTPRSPTDEEVAQDLLEEIRAQIKEIEKLEADLRRENLRRLH